MTVYVDDMRRRRTVGGGRPRTWSHLMADTHDELMEFARRLGLRADWLQHAGTHREHFDVVEQVRTRALRLGATAITYPHGTAEFLGRKRRDGGSRSRQLPDAAPALQVSEPVTSDRPGVCGHCGEPFARGTRVVAAITKSSGQRSWCLEEHTTVRANERWTDEAGASW